VLWGGDVSITLAGVTSVDNTKCTATDEYLDGLGNCDTLGGGTHEILSGTHTDSTAASVVRGDLITGQLATPKWQRLAMGTINQFLGNDGTDVAWEDIVLASAHFANQGATTTVLHGNAAGNPTWGAVDLTADVSGDLPYTNLAQMGAYTLMLNNSAGTADPAAVKITGLTLEGSPEALDFIMIERADGTLAYSDIGNLPGGGTPGGSDTHVQFNDATAFGGESTFTYNKTTNTMNVEKLTTTDQNTLGTPAPNYLAGFDNEYDFTPDKACSDFSADEWSIFDKGEVGSDNYVFCSGQTEKFSFTNIGTLTDNSYCQGVTGSGFDCTISSIPDADVSDTLTASIIDLEAGTVTNIQDMEILMGEGAGDADYLLVSPCAADEKPEFTDGTPNTFTCEAIGGLVSADISGLQDEDLGGGGDNDFGDFTCTGGEDGCTLNAGTVGSNETAADFEMKELQFIWPDPAATDEWVAFFPAVTGTIDGVYCRAIESSPSATVTFTIDICDGQDTGDDTCTTSILGSTLVCDEDGAEDTGLSATGFVAGDLLTIVVTAVSATAPDQALIQIRTSID
jgi:hypothetical protein